MRCEAFYERWKKDPNWCEKSPDSVREIDHYIETHTALVNLGADPGAVYKLLPSSAARELLKVKDERAKKNALANAAGMIKRGDKISVGDIKTWAGLESPLKLLAKPKDPTIVGKAVSEPSIKSTTGPAEDDTPGWQDYLNKQIRRCRQQKCPQLIDEEGDILGVCKEMEKREGTKTQWRRYDCPLHPSIPEGKPQLRPAGMTVRAETPPPKPYEGSRVAGESFKPSQESASGIVHRPGPSPGQVQGQYRVNVTRGQEPILRQMIRYGIAEDEREAAQTAFDKGLAVILDEIEERVQAEGVNE